MSKMTKNEKAALKVLREAANVYNCWACLDEAMEGGEDEGFTRDLIECERGMLAGAITDLQKAIRKLGKAYGISVTTSKTKVQNGEGK